VAVVDAAGPAPVGRAVAITTTSRLRRSSTTTICRS